MTRMKQTPTMNASEMSLKKVKPFGILATTISETDEAAIVVRMRRLMPRRVLRIIYPQPLPPEVLFRPNIFAMLGLESLMVYALVLSLLAMRFAISRVPTVKTACS